jgi:hypothetical protein
MRVKNPAYTEIVGRETDLKGRRLRGNPICGRNPRWENRGNFLRNIHGACMKNIYEVLRQKELELSRLEKEVEALRVAAPLLSEDDEADNGHPKLTLASSRAVNATPQPDGRGGRYSNALVMFSFGPPNRQSRTRAATENESRRALDSLARIPTGTTQRCELVGVVWLWLAGRGLCNPGAPRVWHFAIGPGLRATLK